MGAISRLPLPDRFCARVSKTDDGCWLCAGSKDGDGYGRLQVCGSPRTGAHKYSLELALGRPLLPGMFACHVCDIPACVRPDHLFEGTNADNQRDSVHKGRKNARRGSTTGAAKLSEEDVGNILTALASGERQRGQAVKYGVSAQTIWTIAHGKAWTHVRRLP